MSAIGSLFNENIRLEMDNPLFKKLQLAIEQDCRNKDWFAMAEQALNTVYALAERPDQFCDQLIKNLTMKAFNPKKDDEQAPPRDPEAMDEDATASSSLEDHAEEGEEVDPDEELEEDDAEASQK